MINLVRKYQQPALIFFTILVICSFILFWNGTQAGRAGLFTSADKRAAIFGQTITATDISRVEKIYSIAAGIGLRTLVDGVAGPSQNDSDKVNNFIVNYYVFEHEADALGIHPTDSEVQDELMQVPGFQTDDRFDPVKLTNFVQEALPSLGFNDTVLDDILRDQVRVKKLMALIGSTVDFTPAELQSRYIAENEKMELWVIRLKTSDLEKAIDISDADAQDFYSQHEDAFKSDQQVRVKVAAFELSPAERALAPGPERSDALTKAGKTALAFSQAVVDATSNFDSEAKAFGAALSTTGFFSNANPAPALAEIQLSPQYPSSDVLGGTNGYYVLGLDGTMPSRQLSFAEARPLIVTELKKERASQLMQTDATNLRAQILQQLAAGKSFSDAAAAAGAIAESIPPFTLFEALKMDIPDIEGIAETAVPLGNGQLSDFAETSDGGLIVYLQRREPVDDKNPSVPKEELSSEFTREMQMEAFFEWMRLRRDAAHVAVFQQAAG
jgi:hypothetical protein